jgi:hypothetical protein
LSDTRITKTPPTISQRHREISVKAAVAFSALGGSLSTMLAVCVVVPGAPGWLLVVGALGLAAIAAATGTYMAEAIKD